MTLITKQGFDGDKDTVLLANAIVAAQTSIKEIFGKWPNLHNGCRSALYEITSHLTIALDEAVL